MTQNRDCFHELLEQGLEAEFVPLMVFWHGDASIDSYCDEHRTRYTAVITKAPAEFLDQRELFRESDITSAVAFLRSHYALQVAQFSFSIHGFQLALASWVMLLVKSLCVLA